MLPIETKQCILTRAARITLRLGYSAPEVHSSMFQVSPTGREVLEHFFQIASNAAMFISNERGKNVHYNDTSFVFIGAVFQKLRHFKHSFLDVRGMMREGRKNCDGLTFL